MYMVSCVSAKSFRSCMVGEKNDTVKIRRMIRSSVNSRKVDFDRIIVFHLGLVGHPCKRTILIYHTAFN